MENTPRDIIILNHPWKFQESLLNHLLKILSTKWGKNNKKEEKLQYNHDKVFR